MATPVNVPGIVPNYTANGADVSGLGVTVVWNFGPFTSNPGIHTETFNVGGH